MGTFKNIFRTKTGIAGCVTALLTLAPLASYLQHKEDSGSALGVSVVFGIATIILFVLAYRKARWMPDSPVYDVPPPPARTAPMGVHVKDAEFEAFVQYGRLPNVENTPVFLGEGETAVYFCDATRIEVKNRVVGKTASSGVSVRVAKGVTVRTGTPGGQSVYGDVEIEHPGQFVVTTKRLVFIAGSKAFEEKLEAVSAVTPVEDRLQILTTKNSYTLKMPVPKTVCDIIRKCREQQ